MVSDTSPAGDSLQTASGAARSQPLQVLSPRCPAEDDDAASRRVYPPLPVARASCASATTASWATDTGSRQAWPGQAVGVVFAQVSCRRACKAKNFTFEIVRQALRVRHGFVERQR